MRRAPAEDEIWAATKGKRAPPHKVAEWVFDHINVNFAALDADSFPSWGAYTLLKQANSDPQWFMKEVWVKTLPNKSQLEIQERQRDDGRVLDLLTSFDKEFHANLPNGPGSESPLPEGTVQTGAGEQDGARGNLARVQA